MYYDLVRVYMYRVVTNMNECTVIIFSYVVVCASGMIAFLKMPGMYKLQHFTFVPVALPIR